MTNDLIPTDLLAILDALGFAIDNDLTLVEDSIAEQRRQANAVGKRRQRDAAQYALGGTFMMLGFEQVDDTVLVGLFAHADLMLRWLVDSRAEHGPASFANLVDHALADPGRLSWCREWGVHLRWDRQRQLYQLEVTSFLTSGRTGAKEKWRRDPISRAQAYLIDLACELKQWSNPDLATKGEAFEWLRDVADGNPKYWAPPTTPAAWGSAS